MNLLTEARNILEQSGFEVFLSRLSTECLFFEDDAILGFVSTHQNLKEIFEMWEKMQDDFLKGYGSNLRSEPNKSWNAYSVFLSQASPDASTMNQLIEIEEDLRGTRKIIGHTIVVRTDITRCLLPVLPIQSKTMLLEDNHLDRLKERIEIPDLLQATSVEALFTELMRRK